MMEDIPNRIFIVEYEKQFKFQGIQKSWISSMVEYGRKVDKQQVCIFIIAIIK